MLLKETVLVPFGLLVKEAAERLCIVRVAFSRVLKGRAGISRDLVIRLQRVGVSTARFCGNNETVLRSDFEN